MIITENCFKSDDAIKIKERLTELFSRIINNKS